MLRNRIYYRVKPYIPQSLRTALRRRIALRLRKTVADVWPIWPGSEQPPKNWAGWPEGKKFAFVLTHDVESAPGLQKCRSLMHLDREFGFRSSFNFVPEGDYQLPSDLREELTQSGFEVGIHDLRHDGRLYQSHREFCHRAMRINRYLGEWGATGFRSAFMLHNLDWLHELEIQYDASTFDTDPFEPQPEGRHTIFPFWVPAPGEQRSDPPMGRFPVAKVRSADRQIPGGEGQPPSRLRRPGKSEGRAPEFRHSPVAPNLSEGGGYVELPYTLPQDFTLFVLLGEKTAGIWQRKLDWIAEHGGMALFITHPDYMKFPDEAGEKAAEYPVELYKQFLEYVRSRYSGQYWHALPREVAAHLVRSERSSGSARSIFENSSLLLEEK